MPNPVVHFEVLGPDGAKLQSFYGEAFGWTVDTNNPMDYGIVDNGGEGINGGVAGSPDGTSHATFYVQVDDPQAALEQIEKLGGTTIMPMMEVPGGPTIAMFTDPAGNRVGLVKAMTM
jgi:predicted enzyme related to lactoylglutathione lyase